jgi:S1-C subfamily serine protease
MAQSTNTTLSVPTEVIGGMVSIQTLIPEEAMTAGLLGTHRSGHGAIIRSDGLIVTIGYVIADAETVWITNAEGQTVPGYVVGYDYESGLGLVKATLPLPGVAIPIGDVKGLHVGDPVLIAGSGGETDLHQALVIAKHEFAGRWEYVIDEAVFTSPAHSNWAGTALLDERGRLCGIGSLLIQDQRSENAGASANMYVPTYLLEPYIDEICEHGARISPPRPWLGMLVHDEGDQLIVVGVYRDCPADRDGLLPGDIIMRVADTPVSGLATLFRTIWSIGPAGTQIPLTVLRRGMTHELVITSGDRNLVHRRGSVN